MTPEQLQSLINAGETLDVELKGEGNRALPDRDLVETVVCLANASSERPAWLLIGVEDDGRITGARPRHEAGRTDLLRLQALIANRTRPSLACRAELFQVQQQEVLVIEVPRLGVPVGTVDGKYLRRALGGRGEPQCVPFHFHEMQSLLGDRGGFDFSAATVPEASWSDLDPLEFERFRRTIRESHGAGDQSLLELTDLDLAKALGAVVADREVQSCRSLALLLFGKEDSLRRLVPTHEVAFQVLEDLRVSVNEFFRWPLLRVMDELLARVRARNSEREVFSGPVRIAIPDYPERALREGAANALIHRDYAVLGAVHVQLVNQGVEISSPGGFPAGVRLDNLLVVAPKPRNLLLADAFKRAGIVDRTSRGINTIYYEQLRCGRRPPDYHRSSSSSVVLVMPGGDPDLKFVEFVASEGLAERPLSLEELIAIDLCRDEPSLDIAAVSRAIQRTEAEARELLQRLIEKRILAPKGRAGGQPYELSLDFMRRLGQAPPSPRERELAVIQYLERNERITRREAAEALQISSSQARYLLTSMSTKGMVEARGRGRAAHYVKSAD